jgi:hypothetical protein
VSERAHIARIGFWALALSVGWILVPGAGVIFVFGVVMYGYLISEWWLESLREAHLEEPEWTIGDNPKDLPPWQEIGHTDAHADDHFFYDRHDREH